MDVLDAGIAFMLLSSKKWADWNPELMMVNELVDEEMRGYWDWQEAEKRKPKGPLTRLVDKIKSVFLLKRLF